MGALLPVAVLAEVLRHGASPRAAASAGSGVPSSTGAVCCGWTSYRSPWAASSSAWRAPTPPEFFARPSTAAREIASKVERYVDTDNTIPTLLDCCNGLLLLAHHVVNAATMQSASVPPSSAWPDDYGLGDAYLVFDPLVSPNNYKVLLIQDPSFYEGKLEDGSEWPPSSYTMWIYSSTTGGWKERPLVWDNDPVGTFADTRSTREPETRHTVYWRVEHSMCIAHAILSCGTYFPFNTGPCKSQQANINSKHQRRTI